MCMWSAFVCAHEAWAGLWIPQNQSYRYLQDTVCYRDGRIWTLVLVIVQQVLLNHWDICEGPSRGLTSPVDKYIIFIILVC